MSSNDDAGSFWFVWLIFVAVFVVLLVWRCIRRQQILAHQDRIYARNNAGVQMMTMTSSSGSNITAPPGFTPVLINGQLAFQPIYSAAAAYPPPDYQQYAPGQYAVSVPFSAQPVQGGGAVAAIPVQYHEQGRGYRLTDPAPPSASQSSLLPSPPPRSPLSAMSHPSQQEQHYDGETSASHQFQPSQQQPMPARYNPAYEPGSGE